MRGRGKEGGGGGEGRRGGEGGDGAMRGEQYRKLQQTCQVELSNVSGLIELRILTLEQ